MSGWTFCQIPITTTQDSDLSDGAFRLLVYLAWRQGNKDNTWPLLATMAQDLGVSTDTVGRRLKKLEQAGYVKIDRRAGKSSIYEVSTMPAEMQVTAPQECGSTDSKSAVHNDIHELESKDEKDEKTSELEGEAALEVYFGPRETPIEQITSKPPVSEGEYRQQLLETEQRMFARLIERPWLEWSDGRFRPWEGVTVEAQEHVAWLVEKHTGLVPVHGDWRFWGECCAQVCLAGNGDWDVIEQGIRAVWQRELQYRPGHVKGFVDEVRKAKAIGLQEDILEVPSW
jgi:DNA-binding transcriptional regulator YhcF (GntR family)